MLYRPFVHAATLSCGRANPSHPSYALRMKKCPSVDLHGLSWSIKGEADSRESSIAISPRWRCPWASRGEAAGPEACPVILSARFMSSREDTLFDIAFVICGVSTGRLADLVAGLVVAVVVVGVIKWAGGGATGQGTDDIAFADGACASTGRKPWRDAVYVEFVATGQTHHLAHAVDVFLQTHNTFDLSSHILPPLC